MAGSFDGGRPEAASGQVVRWREVLGCKWLGCSMEEGLRRQAAGLFDGRSEGAGGWVVRWREV